tara:strand:+ start:37 stop:309 length:273 start_codon:yes stop_codon:yes gene_type:complete
MSLIGKPVCDVFGNVFRYGAVQSETMKGKWKYVTVAWVNDEAYTERMKELKGLRGGEDHTRYEYRVDQVKFIDLEKQINDLRGLRGFIKG